MIIENQKEREIGLEQKRANTVQRESGIELYRIITMLVIVAHHYIVNSGIIEMINQETAMNFRAVFAMLFGWGGKTGINCFVLITGYFMCKSHITVKKFLKLLLSVEFYSAALYVLFVLFGYRAFRFLDLIEVLMPIQDIATGFTSAYLVFMLFIPFLNVLLHALTQKQHQILIFLSVFVYSVWSSIGFEVTFNYVTWFAILYVIAAYVRLYPNYLFENKKLWAFMSIISLLLSWLSVISLMYAAQLLGKNFGIAYYFVSDSNKILALVTGLCTFMFFKNINIGYHPWINKIAASAFGVLLIHANSDTMRQWLWRDTLDNVRAYYSEYFVIHAVSSVLAVYIACTVIDFVRIQVLEKPFLKWYDDKLKNKDI